jgi:hypothetical protein
MASGRHRRGIADSTRRALRTALHTLVAAAPVILVVVPALHLPPGPLAAVGGALVTAAGLVSKAVNVLEDRGLLPAWLKGSSPLPGDGAVLPAASHGRWTAPDGSTVVNPTILASVTMREPVIAVVNKSTLVTDADVAVMVRAVGYQLRHHAAPAWGIPPMSVRHVDDEIAAPAGSCVIAILDDADQAGDLGWHTEGPGGVVYGRVFARPVLDNGGHALDGDLSVSSVLSHEVLETAFDRHVNLWADAGAVSYAYEVCDPVESDSYPVTVNRRTAMVSNFVTPAWFDANAAAGEQLDWLGKLTRPFQLGDGGYVITMRDGKVSQTFADRYPDWRRQLKQRDGSRLTRRVARA